MSSNNKTIPLVSVWMITYNHEKFIRQSLQSVIMQKTNFAFEVIIGEDCSTDGTKKIIQEFQRDYPDIIKPIYNKPNVGAYRNAYENCFPKLQGKYIACLEGDDYWIDENKLQLQVDALENDNTAVICFTEVKVWDEGGQQFVENQALKFINKKKRFSFLDILSLNVISTASVLFKNTFESGIPEGFHIFHIQDWPLYLFLLQRGDAIYIDKITTVYRKHGGGVYSQTDEQKRKMINLEVYHQLLKFTNFNKFKTDIKKEICTNYAIVANMELIKDKPDVKIIKNSLYNISVNINSKNIALSAKSFIKYILYTLHLMS